jgi:hypothetical protein
MTRIFSIINPSALGPQLELEEENLIVVGNSNDMDIHRMARGTVGISSGMRYFEAAFYGEGALEDHVSVGIVKSNHSLSTYVGQQALGYGYRVGDGGIYNNDTKIENCDPADKEVYIGVLIDMTAVTCSWFVNGSLVATTAIDSGTWYPAVTVSAVDAYDLRAYVNFGQYAFATPQRGTVDNTGPYVAGWYQDTVSPSQLRLCPKKGKAFHTQPTDLLASVSFMPRILNPEQFKWTRKCSVWTQNNRNSGATFGSIEVDNADGYFDTIGGEDRRDQIVSVMMCRADDSYNNAQVICTGVVDSVTPVGETAVRFTVKDRLSTLERAFQRRRFDPWADEGVANTPIPVTLGANRNINPPLQDAVNRTYRLHDGQITNIVAVRDKAALLDPNSSPPQYVPSLGGQAVDLQTDAVGLLTVDASSQGTQVVIPGADDILDGDGTFTTWPNPLADPPNWVSGGTVTALVRTGTAQSMPQDYVVALETSNSYNPQAGRYGAWLRYDTANLLPGKSYRVQFKLVRSYGAPSPIIGNMSFGLMVRTDLTELASGAVTPLLQPLQAPQFGSNGQSYSFVYKVPPGAARKLYFIVAAAKGGTGAGVGLSGSYFYDVKVELLGEITASLPLEGITLQAYMREVFARAGVPDSDWVSSDAAAIDLATGYTGGTYIRDQITVRAALEIPLDSYGACLFTDKLGRYRVRRLVDPTNVSDGSLVATFDASNIMTGVNVSPDLAPGLTTQMGARRNVKAFSESDFVTDTLAVPMAMRTQFMRDFQFIEPFGGTLSSTYAFASLAPPIGSWFDDNLMARREISRICVDYLADRTRQGARTKITTTPRFIEFAFIYRTLAPTELLFGDAIKATYRRHRLGSGQKLAVFDVEIAPYNQTCTVLARGVE